jgi:hypothetical protein
MIIEKGLKKYVEKMLTKYLTLLILIHFLRATLL